MGHKPGFEFRKLQKYAADNRWTREQFLDAYNDPSHYQPELPDSNMGHQGEDMTNNYYGP